jgi:hypothetical protein
VLFRDLKVRARSCAKTRAILRIWGLCNELEPWVLSEASAFGLAGSTTIRESCSRGGAKSAGAPVPPQGALRRGYDYLGPRILDGPHGPFFCQERPSTGVVESLLERGCKLWLYMAG